MIGDPSGKSEERNLLSLEQIELNIASLRLQMQRFLSFDDPENGALLLNNHQWIGQFSYLEFLGDVGKHFPVNVMLTKDSVKSRLGRSDSGLSYTEFSYMLLQAYDFVHLYRTHGCELQVGGSDQWGNITAGIDLARRMESVQLYGMTNPLLTKSDGQKMGKTESGALWLSPEKTSPYQFYQYWINIEDADVRKCLCLFSDASEEEIDGWIAEHQENPGRRSAQRKLAEAVTELVHGEEGLQTARRATEIFFGAEIADLTDRDLVSIFADVPSHQMARGVLEEGLPIVDALVASGLAKSKSEARRTVQQGGAYVNNRKVTDLETSVGKGHLASETVMVLRSGKKRYSLLRFSEE
jgi:tyrosyl-tRNA synthetase